MCALLHLSSSSVLTSVVSARASTTDLSAFVYSPSVHTPRPRQHAGSTSSWLSSPTATPASAPPWEYSPSIPSPNPAYTRPRSVSPAANLPSAGPTPKAGKKGSTFTAHTALTYSTPGSALQSPGGSIIAGYEPDPFHPMPRSYESLTSYPLSPSQTATSSRIDLVPGPSGIAFRPEEKLTLSGKISSTWTLESYHSAQEFTTPDPKGWRAPPPPPMPCDMPLPPTPRAVRNEAVYGWHGKDSMELLIGEREWVEVEADGDGLDGWGKGGKGVGSAALICVIACYVRLAERTTLIAGFHHSPSCGRSDRCQPDPLPCRPSLTNADAHPRLLHVAIPNPNNSAQCKRLDQINLDTPFSRPDERSRALHTSRDLTKAHPCRKAREYRSGTNDEPPRTQTIRYELWL